MAKRDQEGLWGATAVSRGVHDYHRRSFAFDGAATLFFLGALRRHAGALHNVAQLRRLASFGASRLLPFDGLVQEREMACGKRRRLVVCLVQVVCPMGRGTTVQRPWTDARPPAFGR